MKWLKPQDEHIVYEALSAIADGRFELTSETTAKSTSTSKGKYYEIEYNKETNSIMSNDNMAYYRGEISYPMVAMLIEKGEIEFNREILIHLKDIMWKDINQRNKNDYMKSVREVLDSLSANNVNVNEIKEEVDKIFQYILNLDLNHLGRRKVPPKSY